jgi:hypothetical protein
MTAELDVFSGRPNPQWELTNDEWAELRRRIGTLPELPAGTPAGGLGYRGIVLTPRENGEPNFSGLVVGRGVVMVTDAQGSEQAFEDTDRSIEAWLLHMAQTRLGSDFRSLIEAVIEAEPGLRQPR